MHFMFLSYLKYFFSPKVDAIRFYGFLTFYESNHDYKFSLKMRMSAQSILTNIEIM